MKKIMYFSILWAMFMASSGVVNAENVETNITSWNIYTEPRSTYTTNYKVTIDHVGVTRYYDGQNICFISHNATNSEPWHHNNHLWMQVELYRKKTWWSDYIGTVSVPWQWRWKAMWTNVGPGNYYFRLTKDSDQVEVRDEFVTLTNDCHNYR